MPKEKRDEYGQRSFSLWMTDALRNTVAKRAKKLSLKMGQYIKIATCEKMAREDTEKYKRKPKKPAASD